MPFRLLLPLALAALAAGCGTDQASPPIVRPAAPPDAVVSSPVEPSPAATPSVPPSAALLLEENHPEVAAPAPVVRPADDRPVHDPQSLARFGIATYAARRLVLVTDLAFESARPIPPLVDQLYAAWTSYFGELPPARDGSEFQITGYLMHDRARFEAAGLIPPKLPPFLNGRHRGARFWMNDQSADYYRRHLVCHEATHCFMTIVRGGDGPVWYMEGMAELFGTHRIAGNGTAAFCVMPESPDEVPDWGRIDLLRDEVAAGRFMTLDEVFAYRSDDYLKNPPYAWSWAAAYFFDAHPRYRDRFRGLADVRLRQRFGELFTERFGPDDHELQDEWAVFAHTLRYGHDLTRAAVDFTPGRPLNGLRRLTVAADRGWQSSGVQVEAGRRYAAAASGLVTLAVEPRPWTSSPAGVSYDRFDGRSLGRLLAAVRADGPRETDPASGLLTPLDVGEAATLTAAASGTLYFRVNDAWDRLDDNRGRYEVTVEAAE